MKTVMERKAESAWYNVMPQSICRVSSMSTTIYGNLYLAKDQSEFPNGISNNDPLAFSFQIDQYGTYHETATSLYIKPPIDSYLALGRVNMRKKTIKNITEVKLVKRFNEVRDFIILNKVNLARVQFDINDKI